MVLFGTRSGSKDFFENFCHCWPVCLLPSPRAPVRFFGSTPHRQSRSVLVGRTWLSSGDAHQEQHNRNHYEGQHEQQHHPPWTAGTLAQPPPRGDFLAPDVFEIQLELCILCHRLVVYCATRKINVYILNNIYYRLQLHLYNFK